MSTVTPAKHVRVGVGVLVKVPGEDKVWCGIRKGSHGAGSLALPGGHLEMFETWEECAAREVLEETGLILDESTIRMIHVTNDPMPDEGKHYVTIFMGAVCCEERNSTPITAKNLEPHKCDGWAAYSLKELKENDSLLFGPLNHLVEQTPASVLEFFGVGTK